MPPAAPQRTRLPLSEPELRPSFGRERAAIKRGILPVAGCDEAGRGPLAGPVVAAAVILDPKRIPRGLDDSKKLTCERREELYDRICARAEVAVAIASPARIDRDNILQASLWALAQAVAALPTRPQSRAGRRPRPHQGRLRMPARDQRRCAGALDRRRIDRRQGHPRPADDAPRRRATPAMASSATWATACRSISRR